MANAISDIVASLCKAVKHALTSGSNGQAVLALWAVGAVTILPLTLFHPAWCYSVGYGASVATMALAMMTSFDITKPRSASELLLYATFLYGTRLAAYLLVRTFSVKSMREHQTKATERVSRLIWGAISIMFAGLYTCMVSPVLFLLRSESIKLNGPLQWAGVFVAYLGFFLEAIADQQKFHTKRRYKADYGDKKFVGPTQGVYTLCRHPNYFGEVAFWTGLLLGGMSGFGQDLMPWICGILGWITIVNLMLGSAKRLDEKQEKTYGMQKVYDDWRNSVTASIIPFVR